MTIASHETRIIGSLFVPQENDLTPSLIFVRIAFWLYELFYIFFPLLDRRPSTFSRGSTQDHEFAREIGGQRLDLARDWIKERVAAWVNCAQSIAEYVQTFPGQIPYF